VHNRIGHIFGFKVITYLRVAGVKMRERHLWLNSLWPIHPQPRPRGITSM